MRRRKGGGSNLSCTSTSCLGFVNREIVDWLDFMLSKK
jgi:hypothetical protein